VTLLLLLLASAGSAEGAGFDDAMAIAEEARGLASAAEQLLELAARPTHMI